MGEVILEEQASPGAGVTDKVIVYPKAGGGAYKMSDDDVEHQILTNVGQQTIPTINLTGGQIVFPGTAVPSANANTLDGYEENTVQMAYEPTSGSFTSIAYASRTAYYTIIGNRLFFNLLIYTSEFTNNDGSGAIKLTGLPTADQGAALVIGDCRLWGGDMPSEASINGANITLYYRVAVNGANTALQVSDMATGATKNLVQVSGNYPV